MKPPPRCEAAAPTLPAWTPDPAWIDEWGPTLRGLVRALDPKAVPGLDPAAFDGPADACGSTLSAIHRHFLGRHPPVACLPPFLDHARLHQINAERVMEDTFVVQHLIERQPRRPDGGLDWRHRGPHGDREWAWILNRHGFLRSLVVAWRTTGDPRYPERADALLADWIACHPHPGRFSTSAAWRPLEAARRVMDSWVEVFFAFAGEPAFRPETRLMMLASLRDHGQRLRHHHFPAGNHLLTEMAGLAVLGTAWPEFREAPDWLDYSERRTLEELDRQVYPDGSHWELANHYQRLAIEAFERLARLWAAAGRDRAARRLGSQLTGMWQVLADLRLPDGSGPMNNDSGEEPNAHLVADAAARHPGLDPGGGSAPAHRHLPWAGQVVLRSGWQPDADWLWFDAGPRGSDHQHDDFLHLSLSACGVPILVDPGRYRYQPGPWRTGFTAASGHNCLLWNGQPCLPPPDTVKQPLPLAREFETDRAWAAASARFPAAPLLGAGGPRWTRTVLWLGAGRFVVADWLDPWLPGTVTACWQFHPERRVEIDGSAIRLSLSGGGSYHWQPSVGAGAGGWTLDCRSGQGLPDPRGWYSRAFNRKEPAASLRAGCRMDRPGYRIWQGWPDGTEPPLSGEPTAGGRSVGSLELQTVAGRIRLGGPEPEATAWL